MPPKKKTEENPEAAVRTIVRAKRPDEWKILLAKAEEQHWRKIRVTVRMREKLVAGKPAKLDTANIMLKARGLEDQIEAIPVDDPEKRAQAAEGIVQDEGLCEFHRRSIPVVHEGLVTEKFIPGCWFPTNNIKAGLKENWSVLGHRVEHRGSRGALAEAVFVTADLSQVTDPREKEARTRMADGSFDKAELDWVYLAPEPHGVYHAVAHTMGPQGPKHAVKRHEYILRPEITFVVTVAKAIMDKLPDDAFASTLVHFGEHGMGACRSQGFGRFDLLNVEDVEG